MRLHFLVKEKIFCVDEYDSNLIISAFSNGTEKRNRNEKIRNKLHLNKLMNRQFFTFKEQL